MAQTPKQVRQQVQSLLRTQRAFNELRSSISTPRGIVHKNGVRYVPVNGQVK